MKKAKKISIPDDWKFAADHVTINVGRAIDTTILGLKVNVKVLSYAYDENVLAVGVKPEIELEFQKAVPHITIAFNALGGARPMMSNQLTKWKPVPQSFIVSGIIKEVEEDVEPEIT